ncbi:TIGR03085 family metal-binding protein [Actinotalea sp.]|uniref:TIGR03085 family metal-binding protein n=1 Tax=Actinotalea sp. TaxID=1872145 RepID=UPI00356A7A66
MAWHPRERAAVVEALEAVGPGSPTCCAGWRTEHLAAHLVLREREPLTAAGIVVPLLAGRTERRTQELGDASTSPQAWSRLLDQVRQGPPWWSPLRLAGDDAQLIELFVHAEDVRRGRGRTAPRHLPAAEREAIWRRFTVMARALYRSSPVGVVLSPEDGPDVRVRTSPVPASPAHDVVLRGPLGELVLHAYGRSAVAEVEVLGHPDAVAAMDALFPRRV